MTTTTGSRRTFLATGAAALGTLAAKPTLAAIGDSQFAQIVIGVNAPFSGEKAHLGESLANGVRAAITYANQYGGTLANSFGMRTFDDMDALATATVNAQFASDDPSIVAVIGGPSGSILNATLQTYVNTSMPLIVPTSTYDPITSHGYRNIFRLPTKDSTEGQLYARYLSDTAKPKYAIAVSQDGDYGYYVIQGFTQQAKVEHFKADSFIFAIDKPDYTAAAAKIVGVKPDYIFLAGATRTMGPLIPALRTAGYTGTFGASEGFFTAETADKYSKDLGKLVVSSSMPPLQRAPSAFQLLQDYQHRYGQIDGYSAFGYAAAQILIAASRRLGATGRITMLEALQNNGSYDTIVGQFRFTFSGDPIDPNLYFYSLEDGKFKFEKPAHPTGFVL
ncbi:MAG: branched-chain amino acid ABC transporter substrate-binding protein [Candidatus Eremiobacteraeota bacterium]|nr:branched-chain amino acid ABC transporter substrate-binding protein [Candidatus Eremiobacteraeota bacterium]